MKSGKGKLFVFSAPSGAGKTTLVRKVMGERPNLKFSTSYTTRPQRDGEIDGRDYHFLAREKFDALRDDGEFLEHAEVFGNCYGTGKREVETLRNAGHDVLLEIDWQGAQQVRGNLPDCRSVFILPPSRAELERRLRGRETDAEDVIRRRLGEAVADMSHWHQFDHVVVNDDLDQAAQLLQAIVAGSASGTSTADPVVRARIKTLLGE